MIKLSSKDFKKKQNKDEENVFAVSSNEFVNQSHQNQEPNILHIQQKDIIPKLLYDDVLKRAGASASFNGSFDAIETDTSHNPFNNNINNKQRNNSLLMSSLSSDTFEMPTELKTWSINQLNYAFDWAKKTSKKNFYNCGNDKLISIPFYVWCSGEKQKDSIENEKMASCCLAVALSKWEPLPIGFVEKRNRLLSDVEALTKKLKFFITKMANNNNNNNNNKNYYNNNNKDIHKIIKHASDNLHDFANDWVLKNQKILKNERDDIRMVTEYYKESISTIFSNSEWMCQQIKKKLEEILALNEETKSYINKEFEPQNKEFETKVTSIKREIYDLQSDIGDSNVLSDTVLASMKAISENSGQMDIDELSYIQNELIKERDRLLQGSYLIKGDNKAATETMTKIQTEFNSLREKLEMLSANRATLLENSQKVTDPNESFKLEMDLQNIENEIGSYGARMVGSLKIKSNIAESRMNKDEKKNLIDEWLKRLEVLTTAIDDIFKIQNKITNRQEEMYAMTELEIKKVITDVYVYYDKLFAELGKKITDQLYYKLDNVPKNNEIELQNSLAKEKLSLAKQKLSQYAINEPALKSFDIDAEQLYKTVFELIEAQNKVGKMMIFEEMLKSLKDFWVLNWATSKKKQ